MSVTHKPGPLALKLNAALKELSGVKGKVGWFETAKYADGTPVALVAATQEFGHPAGGIRPRPFFRPTIDREQAAWRDLARGLARRVLRGEITASQMMDLLGMQAAGDVSKTITQLTTPALKVATVKARLRKLKNGGVRRGAISITAAKPLVDSGILLATLTSTVEGA